MNIIAASRTYPNHWFIISTCQWELCRNCAGCCTVKEIRTSPKQAVAERDILGIMVRGQSKNTGSRFISLRILTR